LFLLIAVTLKIADPLYGIDETGIFRIKIKLRRVPEADVQKKPFRNCRFVGNDITPAIETHILSMDAELRD